MPSASYSIVPGRTPYESGVAPIEVAAVPAPGEPPPEDDVSHWQVDLMLARLPRITHNALLEVDDSASSELVNQRYHALVRQVDGWRVSESPTLRRKIAIVLDALAEAYETLSAAARRREGLARLRENGR
jgi:hypothetical protein